MKLIQEVKHEQKTWLKLLKNRGIAVIVTIVMIAVAFPLGGYLSLYFLQGDATSALVQGRSSVSVCLKNLADQSAKLATVGRKALDPKNPTLSAVQTALDHWQRAETPQEMYAAYQELTDTTMELYFILGKQTLTDKDERTRAKWLTILEKEEYILSQNSYNKKAHQFNERIAKLPVRVLATTAGIAPLELFSDPQGL